MKKYYLIFLLFYLSINIFIFSQEKIDSKIISNSNLYSTFCEYKNNNFSSGIEISADKNDNNINSISDGEIIFFNINRKFNINFNNTNIVAVQNTNDNYRYIYSNLEKKSFDKSKINIKKGESIGNSNKNITFSDNVYLEVVDVKNDKYINPLSIINFDDTLPPVINDIYFITENNEIVSLRNNSIIKKGGSIFIECRDYINNSRNILAPYKLQLFINGIERSYLIFNEIIKKDNEFIVCGKKIDELYKNKKNYDYYLFDYFGLPGLVSIKVIAEDYFGNKTIFNRIIRITFND